MQFENKKTIFVIFAGLILLMVLTRGSHFGSSFLLPDATLAVFLLAGLMLPRFNLTALIAFAVLLLVAGGIDYYAINMAGVSDWCVTPAYWFLIPTYACMWLGGRWFSARMQNTLVSLAQFVWAAWLSTTVAFIISNGSFYLFSGRYSEISMFDYAERVAQYYLPYLSGSLTYLAIAAVTYMPLILLVNNSTKPSSIDNPTQ